MIGNYVKQRLLKPYHDWAMNVLRRLVLSVMVHTIKTPKAAVLVKLIALT